jgi:hypothetical protein
MAQTYFGSTLRAGSGTLTDTVDGGYVILSQTVSVTTVAAGTAVTGSVTIPASAQILSFHLDQTVDEVVGGGSATAINATIGTAAAGTQYLSATNVIAGGRASLSYTAAQLLAMQNVGSNTGVYFTIAPNGTISTTQGTYVLTVLYAQKV